MLNIIPIFAPFFKIKPFVGSQPTTIMEILNFNILNTKSLFRLALKQGFFYCMMLSIIESLQMSRKDMRFWLTYRINIIKQNDVSGTSINKAYDGLKQYRGQGRQVANSLLALALTRKKMFKFEKGYKHLILLDNTYLQLIPPTQSQNGNLRELILSMERWYKNDVIVRNSKHLFYLQFKLESIHALNCFLRYKFNIKYKK